MARQRICHVMWHACSMANEIAFIFILFYFLCGEIAFVDAIWELYEKTGLCCREYT